MSRLSLSKINTPFFQAGLILVVILFLSATGLAAQADENGSPSLTMEWGGRIKAAGNHYFTESDSIYHDVDKGPYDDASLDGRLILTAFTDAGAQLDLHYETIYTVGDLLQIQNDLRSSDTTGSLGTFFPSSVDDDRRLLDLTHRIHEDDRQHWYHRIDRLALTLTPSWGTVRIGRQALTWGNGLVFNPMDVFNPFSPTDVERDYKTGDDMVAATFTTASGKDIQTAVVLRKDPLDGDVNIDNASFAGKFHGMLGSLEYDIMAARHYEDTIVGSGLSGYLKDAAWRMDATYTFLTEGDSDSGFWSLVLNLDYAWIWLNKNWYGLIEFYTNSLGEHRPAAALENPDLTERLARGELYTLGNAYLGNTIQIELHPLVNFQITAITNLNDLSGILQPRVIWDVIENFQVTVGINGYWGGKDTEFGGITLPSTDSAIPPLSNAYAWLNYFF